ncbi:hypothetical protein PAXRUDRAFT_834183 [Paxillus rubicundulus Ve08.2h10]|uniref:Uncharacterized protein n=1 Tax=Paxillus rubicundulus Ve08.2h10 TaxID=930991 RepID=A0A0D0DLQ5_9AGAM|nr:hypothetical protein PAXRUDRAFT_834183 [Paxillus rubicundulus Ve08.2h10]
MHELNLALGRLFLFHACCLFGPEEALAEYVSNLSSNGAVCVMVGVWTGSHQLVISLLQLASSTSTAPLLGPN